MNLGMGNISNFICYIQCVLLEIFWNGISLVGNTTIKPKDVMSESASPLTLILPESIASNV